MRQRTLRWIPRLSLLGLVAVGCGREPESAIDRAGREVSSDRIAEHGRDLAADRLAGRHHASPEADTTAAAHKGQRDRRCRYSPPRKSSLPRAAPRSSPA